MATPKRTQAAIVTALQGLIGKGAQKAKISRFAQNIQEQYIQAAQAMFNKRRTLENELEDLVSFTGVTPKTGAGMDTTSAQDYVAQRVKLAVDLEQLKIKISAIQEAYKDDFGRDLPVVDTSFDLTDAPEEGEEKGLVENED